MTTETENVKKAWKAEHILRLKVLKNGEPAQDETVLVISDRSYMPLDPLGILKKSEKESRKSLDSIGGNIHDQELMAVGDKMDEGNDMRHTLIMGFLLLDAMCIIAKVIFK